MFSNVLTRVVALLAIVGLLGGCAEIDRRGGLVDQLEDNVLFRADTKSHRLFRSYLLVGVLLTAARRSGQNQIDRDAIAGNLQSALSIANEAFVCLYPGLFPDDVKRKPLEIADPYVSDSSVLNSYGPPRLCQFFDEKMARLDYAIYRLAMTTLLTEQSRQYLSDIRDRLIGKIPVVSDSVRAAIHANKAANQLTSIVDDLLNFTFNGAGPVLALAPLYRDSLEINMWVIIDSLTIRCKRAPTSKDIPAFRVDEAGYYVVTDQCELLDHAYSLMRGGHGNVTEWREFVRRLNGDTLLVDAYRPHFYLVSRLIWESCNAVIFDPKNKDKCKTVLADALETHAFDVNNKTGVGVGAGRFTASIMPETRFAGLRPRGVFAGKSTPRLTVSPSNIAPDPQSTGSIPRPNAAPAPSSAR